MYSLNIFDQSKKLVYSTEVDEPPTDEQVRCLLLGHDGCFADICRLKDDPTEHSLDLRDELHVEVYEGLQSEYA